MPAALYDNFLLGALGGSSAAAPGPNVDWMADIIRCTLHASTYVPAKATHVSVANLTNELTTAGGYTAAGVALANKSCVLSSSVIKLDADDAVWPGASFTARVAVVSDRTPAAAADQPLIWYNDNGADSTASGGEFRVQFHTTNGIAQITIAAAA